MSDSPPEYSPRLTIMVFLVVVLALVGGAFLLLSTRPQPVQITINPPIPTMTNEPSVTPAPTATEAPTATPAPVTVYVTGAVAHPEQLFTLPPGSRVQDAIDAAGGLTDNADLERVNLAAILSDGDQIHVPEKNVEVVLPTTSGGQIVHINTATAEELDTLPGVGPSLAAAIIAYRDTNGAFTSLDDLDLVEGVGPALLENIKDLVVFD